MRVEVNPPHAAGTGPLFRVIGLPIGLVIACIVILIGSFLWSANLSDHLQIETQQRVIRTLLRERARTIVEQVKASTLWSESYFHIARDRDAAWAHANFGNWYWEAYNIEESYLFFDDGAAFQSSFEGKLRGDLPSPPYPSIAEPYVRRVIDRAAIGEGPQVTVFREMTYESGDTAQLMTVADIVAAARGPAILVVGNILPDRSREPLIKGPQPMFAILHDLTDARLATVGAQLELTGLRWGPPDPERGEVGMPITDIAGWPVGILTWRPALASQVFFQTARIPALVTLALIVFVALLISRASRTLLQRLAVSEQDARHRAWHDQLTGLPNRRLFVEVAEGEIRKSIAAGQPAALLIVDLDRFKELNDTQGHAAGDRALIKTAERIAGAARDAFLVCRFGGDEFMIVLIGLAAAEAERTAGLIIREVTKPIPLANQRIGQLGASVGIAVAPDDATDPLELARRADIALYQAKGEGRNRTVRFVAAMEDDLKWARALEAALRQAIADQAFSVVYQPQFDPDGRRVVGAEALLRWVDPELGPIAPGMFIPFAEERRLMWEIGAFVLDRAVGEASRWPGVVIAVNVSTQQFSRGDLPELVRATLARHNFPASRLELEITETALVKDEEKAVEQIRRLKKLGVSMALDDFGTGYSSLSYLRRYDFDKMKVDRSFVRDVGLSPEAKTIVQLIIRMSHALGLKVVAEGVETGEQHTLLRQAGCDVLQGFLLARPMPPAALAQLLSDRQRAERALTMLPPWQKTG